VAEAAAAMTEPAAANRPAPKRPGSAGVYWTSTLLFAAFFAFLTYRFASEQTTPAAPVVHVRKVIKRRVITTVVPTPGQNSVSAGPVTSSASYSPGAAVVTGAS